MTPRESALLFYVWIIGNNLHTKTLGAYCNGTPYTTQPYYAKNFVVKLNPMNLFLSHFPSFRELFARGIFLAAANIIPIVSSVAASVFPVGAFITMIPFLLAASTLIFAIPTPARPIILSLPGFSSRLAVMVVPLLVISAS